MLKQRLLTALVLIPLVIACLFLLPVSVFLVLSALIVLVAGWEWAGLAEIKNLSMKIVYSLLLLGCLVGVMFVPLMITTLIGVAFWVMAAVLVLLYPRGAGLWQSPLIRGLMGLIALTLFWLGLVLLRKFCPYVLFFTLVLIWCADAAAYFLGKKWGQQKILPKVSPGKTYMGLWGGVLSSFLISLIGLWLLEVPKSSWVFFVVICTLGGGFISVLGDLFESMLKRQAGMKDSSHLIPGHGGLLDRIDSLTPTIPLFALLIPFLM